MPCSQFFRELFEIRRMIEPATAALAAERATGADLVLLEQAYRAMEASAIAIRSRLVRTWRSC